MTELLPTIALGAVSLGLMLLAFVVWRILPRP